MMPSMVDVLPNGEELGEYFAVDIGGTNYRVIYVKLSPDKGTVERMDMEDCRIPDEYFTCHADGLFDLLAGELARFAHRLNRMPSAAPPAVGFCFSFPVEQTALDAGTVARLTKRFENEGLLGCDPVQMLSSALKRANFPARVTVLLNDSVGTAAGGRYQDERTMLGIILGTGTNACYVEHASRLPTARLPEGYDVAARSGQMLINTEWGNFTSDTLPVTQVDRDLDASTPNAGEMKMEKMTSGMYMGEVARRLLLRLAEEGGLFGGAMPERLREPWTLSTPALAKIDGDASWGLVVVGQQLGEALGVPASSISWAARRTVRAVCHMVALRSASLAAAATGGLLRVMGRDGKHTAMQATAVVVDGGLFEHYTAFRGYIADALAVLLGPTVAAQVTLRQCVGSCGRGDREAAEPGCSGCSRMRELEAELRQKQALVEALHSKNCMLTILNSNLLMRLDALGRSLALPPAAPPASLHLRISLPGEYAAAGGAKEQRLLAARSFNHTHISVYLVGTFAVACVLYDSTQGVLQRYALNKKWYYLYGATCFFAYLYIRPLIRRGLGSASAGYINFYAVYIGWLCSAVFLHLPSFQALGIDIRTDLSVLLTIFLLSLLVLGALHACHLLAVGVGAAAPGGARGAAGRKEALSLILLNSMSLSVACSTYYSFCGNAAATLAEGGAPAAGAAGRAIDGGLRAALCRKWLHPIGMREHPAFSSWVIYGEGAAEAAGACGAGNATCGLTGLLAVDVPLDGRGPTAIPAAETMSPVFTLWITLVAMYLVNSAVEYSAARVLQAAAAAELRRGVELRRARRAGGKRRHSADFSRPALRLAGIGRHSLDAVGAMGGLLRSFSSGLGGQLLSPQKQPSVRRLGVPAVPEEAPLAEASVGADERPDFLPMFPWYSGTSADMYRTIFDLAVSLKLFLGRFDMRTMQAATGVGMRGPPREGDGFTFEHLAARKELWLDFCADTGDGGDPTYAVARAMAAPLLHVRVPPRMPLPPPDSAVASAAINGHAPPAAGVCDSGSESSSGLDTPRCSSGASASPSDRGGGVRVLPRGEALVLGGDLAYPNPSNETYETRLVRPFEAAMPPPPGVHPGRLVEKSYFALRLPHGWWLFGLDLALVDDIDMCQCQYFARIADERMGPADQAVLVTHQPRWLSDWLHEEAGCHNLRQLVRGHLRGRARVHLAGDLHFYMRHSDDDEAAAAQLSGLYSELAGLVGEARAANEVALAAGLAPPEEATRANLHPFDPEHLIVNGLGGAFLHPTHVFAPARFASVPDPEADAALARGASPRGGSPTRGSSPAAGGSPNGGSPRGASPQRRPLSRRASFAGDAAVGKLVTGAGAVAGGGGEYCCAAAYPAPAASLAYGRQNLHLFRFKNTRFDLIGGAFYFLLVVSVLPRCHHLAAVLDAHTVREALAALAFAAADAMGAIFAESRVSLAALGVLFVLCLGMARSGGIGAVPGPPPPPLAGRRQTLAEALAARGRTGGLAAQVTFALAHTATHLTTAVLALMLLELGVETCIRYEGVGREGYHSLFRWYQRFEAEAFPDPAGLRAGLQRWTLGAYPGVLKAAMAVFDVPEAIAVARATLCSPGGGLAALTRLQAAAFYLGMLAYYWVLATPSVGFLFGAYLYVSVNWFHVHYDEAFSSLQIADHKGFSRLHVTPAGDLHIYGLAMDKVPHDWREDPRWRGAAGGGCRRQPAHRADYPSRWLPAAGQAPGREGSGSAWGTAGEADESEPAGAVKVIDFLEVPQRRVWA
ncbi:hypothetical protein WJX81_007542 [Elliptochloris bilobata]|uniref:hexokinase n=1 Tax=Elliptochloris bilobata TaxID=381761 RepID=A0AAW1RNW3_9CHLO